MTRIVGGVAGGRHLIVPPKGTRPTTDRVRESVFNVLAARMDFDGLRVLDLYAGSGALGLEALSRGAASVLFIENDRRAADVITRNIATVALPGATVRRGTVASVLFGSATPMDLVFADPPYDVPGSTLEEMLASLHSNGWLAPGAVVVVERAASSPSLTWPEDWTVWPERRYGDTRIEAASC